MDDVISRNVVKVENTGDPNPQYMNRQVGKIDQNDNATNFDDLSPPDRKRRRSSANYRNISSRDKAQIKVRTPLLKYFCFRRTYLTSSPFRLIKNRLSNSLEYGEKAMML